MRLQLTTTRARVKAVAAAALALTLTLIPSWAALAQESAPTRSPGAGSTLSGEQPPTSEQPDLLVVMVDDLGDIPDERVLSRLPNIREVWLENGRRFEGMVTQTPLCCPARATLLTGRDTLDHGVITNDGDPLDPSVTIATVLDEAGYHTLLMGKYLNAYEGTRTPPGWDRVMMRERNVGAHFSIDGEKVSFQGMHGDDALREQAVAWVRDAPVEEPLFALISPRAPHRHPQDCERGDTACEYLPLVMEQDRGAEVCADIPPFQPPTYEVRDNGRSVPWVMPDFPDGWPLIEICESLLVVDRMVGELVEAQAGRGRPAYVVFMSDNGMSWGQKGFPQKHVPTASRLPFYIAGPGVTAEPTDALASNIDIAPTLAELGGTTIDAAGTSLVPLLHGGDVVGRDEVLEVMPEDPDGFYAGWAGLRTPQWHYVRWDSGASELYDVTADPWEEENLVDEMPEQAAELEARLETLLADSEE